MTHRLILIVGISALTHAGMAGAEEGPLAGAGRSGMCFSLPSGCDTMPAPQRSSWSSSVDRRDSGYGSVFAQADPDAGRTSSATAVEPPDSEPDTFWGAVWDYLYNGASITAGIGTRQSELSVTRKSDGAAGKIAQRNDAAYFLSYSTRDSFIGTSRVGYTVMLNYSTFYMDKQEVDKQLVDLGTRVKGRVAYLVPTLFYQWGEHHLDGRFMRLGFGLGAGVAKYSGSIILNYPSNTTPTNVGNGGYDLKFAVSLFLEARYRYWGVKVSLAGPSYEDKTYKYSVSDVAVNLGYSYYF